MSTYIQDPDKRPIFLLFVYGLVVLVVCFNTAKVVNHRLFWVPSSILGTLVKPCQGLRDE